MEDPDCQFASIDTFDFVENEVMVVNQGGNVVVVWPVDAVPAMVSDVVDDQLAIVCKQGPKWKIKVDCQAVAMAQDQPGTQWIAVLPHGRDGVVVETYIAHRIRLGYFPNDFLCHGEWAGNPGRRPVMAGNRYQRNPAPYCSGHDGNRPCLLDAREHRNPFP